VAGGGDRATAEQRDGSVPELGIEGGGASDVLRSKRRRLRLWRVLGHAAGEGRDVGGL
jgi:hypothetical protein